MMRLTPILLLVACTAPEASEMFTTLEVLAMDVDATAERPTTPFMLSCHLYRTQLWPRHSSTHTTAASTLRSSWISTTKPTREWRC